MSKGLTSFRALSFFLIYLVHLSGFTNGQLGIQAGYLGIQAFFVLSGFLLTPILLNMKSSLKTKDFFIHFYGRRALRIFPLYYSYIVVVLSAYFFVASYFGYNEIRILLDRFIVQLPWLITYTYDFFHASNYFKPTAFANHFWSLAVEEQFYLIWPFAIFFIPANYLKRFLLLVIVAGPTIRLLLAVFWDTTMLPVLPTKDLFIFVLPFSHFDAFAIGGYFALYVKSRSSYFVWWSIFLVIILGMTTSWLSSGKIQWDELGYGPFMRDSYKFIWGYSIVNFMFAYMLVHIKDKTLVPAIFENPLLVYLGTISYGMYVFHLPILLLVFISMQDLPVIMPALVSLLITIIISIISYEYMERRFINSKDKYFSRVSANK